MINLAGFEITDTIAENSHRSIYRAKRNKDDLPVILKVSNNSDVSPALFMRFKQAQKTTAILPGTSVVKTKDLKKIGKHLVLVNEDFGNIPIRQWMTRQDISLEDKIKAAIYIAETIGHIHSLRLIHQNINTESIEINPGTLETKLSDFEYSAFSNDEDNKRYTLEQSTSDIHYISPEQTGLIAWQRDYRTDYYSYGIVLYELFTSQLPFQTDDVEEMVNFHLAKMPTPPNMINTDLPLAISNIVMKLLEKYADNRYQGYIAIRNDLQKCLDSLQRGIGIPNFQLGLNDVADQFHIGSELYGRDEQLKILDDVISKSVHGDINKTVVLLTGASGTGKSSLINQAKKTISKKYGFMIQGKFDQYQTGVPYIAFQKAFDQLAAALILESEEYLSRLRKRVKSTIGTSIQVIIELSPSLSVIFGKQDLLPEVDAQKAKNRLSNAVQGFIKCIAGQEHPLVLVLDDMQWVDDASLELLSSIIIGKNHKSFLIVICYRDNEVDDTHILRKKIHEFESRNIPIEKIELDTLTIKNVQEMVVDSLKRDSKDIQDIASWAYKHTNGNPFYVRLFLQDAYRKDELWFDPVSEQWKHRVDKKEETQPVDVVDFMASILKLLPFQTKNLLKLITLSGGNITLDILSLLNKMDYSDVEIAIKPAVSNGLVIKHGNRVKISHDRIQQAVNSQIEKHEKIKFHLEIARNLNKGLNDKQHNEKLFKILYHYNLSRESVTDNDERIVILQLNVDGAIKSYLSGAYKNALEHSTIAKSILSSQIKLNHDLNYRVNYAHAKSSYLNGEYLQAKEITENLLKEARTLDEKVPVYDLLKNINMNHGSDLSEVVATGINILKISGINIPTTHKKQVSYMNKLQASLNVPLKKLSTEDILSLPRMEDKHQLLITKLCMDVSEAVYYTGNINLMKIMILTMIDASLKTGNSAESAFAYSMYGMSLSIDEDYEEAYKFGHLATQLITHLDNKDFLPKVNNLLCIYTNIYKRPISTSISLYKDSIKYCKENGDFLYGVWASFSHVWSGLISGRDLREVYLQSVDNYDYVNETNDEKMNKAYKLVQATIKALMDDTSDIIQLSDKQLDFDKLPIEWKTNAFLPGPTWYAILQCQIFALTGEFNLGVQVIRKHAENLSPMVVLFPITQYYFYYGLCLAGRIQSNYNGTNQQDHTELDGCIKKLEKWSKTCPDNFLPQYLLLKAEHARIFGNHWQASELYKKSASKAKTLHLNNIEAIAHETAGRFWLTEDYKHFAKSCIEKSINSFYLWGAMAKVKQLKTKYSVLLGIEETNTSNISLTKTINHESAINTIDSIDMLSVIRASQAISSEINLNKMLKNLMHTLTVNAETENAVLIRERENQWEVVADSSENSLYENKPYPVKINKYNQLPISIIQHVIRFGESVILNNACESGDFISDPYIKSQQARSIACIPLHSNNKLSTIIYLENNLATFSFTDGTLEVLRILLSQAVISLENSILYDQLKNEIQIREEAENRASLLLNSTGEAIYGLDNHGKCIFANPACVKTLGYTSTDELLGRELVTTTHYPPNTFSDKQSITIELANSKVYQTIETGNGAYCDDEYLWRKNGDKFSAEYWSQPITKNGQTKGVVVTFNDITERKNITQELINHRNHLEELVAIRTSEMSEQSQIINQVQDSVFSMDLSGNIRSWNHGAEKQLGHSFEEVIDKHISFVYPESYHDILSNTVIPSAIEHGKHEIEICLNQDTGANLYTHLSLSLLKDESGQPRGLVAYSLDITDRKKSLALLSQRTTELTAVNKELESFSYSVSHDLRAPLRAIDGFSIALLEDYNDKLNEQGKDYLHRVRSGAQRMGELIDDLLRLSRVTRTEIKPEHINLSHVVESVIMKINNMYPKNTLYYSVTPEMYCNADPRLLLVALENMIGNAWKYSHKVEHPSVEVGSKKENGVTVYYIRDNGVGFDDRYSGKLFGAFQRLHHASEFEGNGIGLATVQRVIHLHGGSVWAKAEVNKGATFYFTLEFSN